MKRTIFLTPILATAFIAMATISAKAQHHCGASCHAHYQRPVRVETYYSDHYHYDHDRPQKRHRRVRRQGPPPHAPAHGHRRNSVRVVETRYVYYRDYDMYYDRFHQVYFYPVRGQWFVSAEIPVHIRRSRGFNSCVRVNLDFQGDRPFVAYRKHRRVYAGW
jgi:hypothetical protein